MANGVQSLGQVLRQYRQRLGVTQAELAGRAGVDRAYICRVERGQQKPRFGLMVAESLATALELSYVERAQLLVACGHWPYGDVDLELMTLVAEVMQSPMVGEAERASFAGVVMPVAKWWLGLAW